jgi:hypothetical protein
MEHLLSFMMCVTALIFLLPMEEEFSPHRNVEHSAFLFNCMMTVGIVMAGAIKIVEQF